MTEAPGGGHPTHLKVRKKGWTVRGTRPAATVEVDPLSDGEARPCMMATASEGGGGGGGGGKEGERGKGWWAAPYPT